MLLRRLPCVSKGLLKPTPGLPPFSSSSGFTFIHSLSCRPRSFSSSSFLPFSSPVSNVSSSSSTSSWFHLDFKKTTFFPLFYLNGTHSFTSSSSLLFSSSNQENLQEKTKDKQQQQQQQQLAFQSFLYTPSNQLNEEEKKHLQSISSSSTKTTPPPPDASSQTNTHPKQKPKPSSSDRSSSSPNAWILVGSMLGLGIGGLMYLGRPYPLPASGLDQDNDKDKDPQDIESTHLSSTSGWWWFGSWWSTLGEGCRRVGDRVHGWYTYYQAPAYDRLLPDPLPYGYQKPYTLVINMNEMLIASSWDPQFGWRIKKRPGVDAFLGYLARYYEIVIFTTSPAMVAQPILDQLDTYQSIMYRLYRDATQYHRGHYVKDLTHLNRDLSKVVVLDVNADQFHPHHLTNNTLILKKWNGEKEEDPKHTTDLFSSSSSSSSSLSSSSSSSPSLLEYLPFLETLAVANFPDVRPILQHYHAVENLPQVFAQRQQELLAAQHPKTHLPSASSSSSSSSSLIPSFKTKPTASPTPPLTSTSMSTPPSTTTMTPTSPMHAYLQHTQSMHQQFKEESKWIQHEVAQAKLEKEKDMQQAWRPPPPPGLERGPSSTPNEKEEPNETGEEKKRGEEEARGGFGTHKWTLWELWKFQVHQLMMSPPPSSSSSSSSSSLPENEGVMATHHKT